MSTTVPSACWAIRRQLAGSDIVNPFTATGPGRMKMTAAARHILRDSRRVSRVLARVGDKWSVMVIVYIQVDPRRFNEIKRGIEGISQQMLTRTLRALERDGFVTRTSIPHDPAACGICAQRSWAVAERPGSSARAMGLRIHRAR